MFCFAAVVSRSFEMASWNPNPVNSSQGQGPLHGSPMMFPVVPVIVPVYPLVNLQTPPQEPNWQHKFEHNGTNGANISGIGWQPPSQDNNCNNYNYNFPSPVYDQSNSTVAVPVQERTDFTGPLPMGPSGYPNLMPYNVNNGQNNNYWRYTVIQTWTPIMPQINQVRPQNLIQYPVQQQRQPMHCSFCHKNRERKRVFTSHDLKTDTGIMICPVLRNYICPICGATGDYAHTISYCPQRAREQQVTNQ